MAAYTKFDKFVEDLAKGVHKLHTDSLKIMLANTAPAAGNAVKTDITEIAAGFGYTAGGVAATVSSATQTGGVFKLVLNDPTIAASGGAITARYAVLYNDTPTTPLDPLIGYWDYGSSFTINSGETLTVDTDQTNGAMTIV